jgi:hypothetical protein
MVAAGHVRATEAGASGRTQVLGTKLVRRLSAAAALLAATPALATDLASPIVSGLPWRSGMSCAGAEQEAWRGRRLDVTVSYVPSDSWDSMLKRLKSSYFKSRLDLAPQAVISMPMMPRPEGQHAICAQGAFDDAFRQMGTVLNADPRSAGAVIRLGWEFNRGSRNHAWGVDSPDDIPNYVACFRREVEALRSTAPRLLIEWAIGRETKMGADPFVAYPGGDVVDLIGIHYYDNARGPRQRTQAEFDRQAVQPLINEGFGGILTAFDVAAAHGKKLAVAEWGMWSITEDGLPMDLEADDPVYIANMHNVFKTHAGGLGYENYYGCGDRHMLHPQTLFPRGAAIYQQLWRAGQ